MQQFMRATISRHLSPPFSGEGKQFARFGSVTIGVRNGAVPVFGSDGSSEERAFRISVYLKRERCGSGFGS